MSTLDIEAYANPEDVAGRAADRFAEAALEAVTTRGRFVVALSGGSTPKLLHRLLVQRDDIEWSQVVITLGDERYVPPTDDASNERMVRETLLDLVPVLEENVVMPYSPGGVVPAADRFNLHVPETVDLVFLGLGADAHTLSLFSYEPSGERMGRRAIPARAPVGVPERITLTAQFVLRHCREAIFLVAGEDKADAVWRMTEGAPDLLAVPSQRIARFHSNCRVLLDYPAAQRILDPS